MEESITILSSVGIPVTGKTDRSLERMAMAFLAVAGVTRNWKEASDTRFLKTRDVISFINHSLSKEFRTLIHHFGTKAWQNSLDDFMSDRVRLENLLARQRDIAKVPIKLPNGDSLFLSSGKHNDLQKAIIEEFLPRFGYECEVLYIGDTTDKMLFLNEQTLKDLHFFELSHNELPDIVAYSKSRNVDAVESFQILTITFLQIRAQIDVYSTNTTQKVWGIKANTYF